MPSSMACLALIPHPFLLYDLFSTALSRLGKLTVLKMSMVVSLLRPRWITRFLQEGGQPQVAPHSQIGTWLKIRIPCLTS